MIFIIEKDDQNLKELKKKNSLNQNHLIIIRHIIILIFLIDGSNKGGYKAIKIYSYCFIIKF